MEWFDSRRDDDAFAVQFGLAHYAGVSRTVFAMKLHQLGEDRLLDQLLPRLPVSKSVVARAGDDCAVVKKPGGHSFLVLKTDCLVEGVHFTPEANALEVGWKAMMRPLSDFAATSALPQFALITLIASKETEVEWVKALYRGLRRAAKRFKISIVGGEMSSTPGPIAISVSNVGFKIEMESLPLSRGAKIGSAISEGEDYELLFAISPRHSRRLQRAWKRKFPKLALTRIGQLHQRSNIKRQTLPGGYAHFQQPS